MLFNSFPFIFLFLPLALAGYQLLRRHGVAWLGLCSLCFYAWWDWRFLPLLLASICFNYCAGLAICSLHGRWRAAVFIVSLLLDLGLLLWFKYAAFLFGISAGLPLPIGISFFTFTQLAFLVDCWRGSAREPGFAPYLLFVSYFPHLVAGPVLHHAEMMPQFRNGRPLQAEDLALGLTIFAMGLAKKVLVADNLAPLANPVFAAGAAPQLLDAWIGTLAYAMQLYFDFSGYSDMAIGLSRLFGVRLPENFDSPYQSRNIAEFWRRWHMTLSRFLRDYLYIPLGGNRKGEWRRRANLMATMILGGAWHGAGWTFLAWGALHGVFLVLHQRFGANRPGWWGGPLTFCAVLLAWVPFRSPDLASALSIWAGMAGLHGAGLPHALGGPGLRWIPAGGMELPLLLLAALAAWFAPNTRQLVEQRWNGRLRNAGAVAALLLACVFSMNRPTEFLYFQF
ncbi:MBOAT family O-acyltransferase [Pseudoduganella violaceinigra]|uniref:MBOAT family O-acyltransferase n=1 Tax=Pseudoduganella violaceinigra TaxID=246602 RepID=UPI000415ED56|nr:MBOAT family O-acyltransferase [Pseudoduganella violaceinigra]